MKFPEYIAKQLFAKYGIPVPRGTYIQSEAEAIVVWDHFGTSALAVKAQCLTGGRGKAGGVKVVHRREELVSATRTILNMTIKEEKVTGVLLEEALNIQTEIYLSIILDRKNRKPLLMLCPDGGMDIETVAAQHPERLLKIHLTEGPTLRGWQLRELTDFAEIPEVAQAAFKDLCKALARLFHEQNCSLVEINPLVITTEGKVLAADGKLLTDDNASNGLGIMNEFSYTPPPMDAMEREALEHKLNFIRLDGEIGCMVNGAGLAMATMDSLLLCGTSPANFLDIGGGAKADQVAIALDIIARTPGVKCVFINIFGGIVRCDMVAQGLLEALEINKGWTLPIVVRLAGTNETEGRRLLAGNPIFRSVKSMDEGAKQAKQLAHAL